MRKVVKKKMSRRKWRKITAVTINILSNQKRRTVKNKKRQKRETRKD